MAKKKVNKKDEVEDLDMDLDDLDDLGEMDFGDEDGIDDDNRTPSRSKVVTDLAREAGEGALSSVIKNTAKKALPEEYDSSYHDVMDLAGFTAEVVTKNKQALNKSMFHLGKEVKKLLPFKVGMLDNYLEKQQSEFETFRSQTEEQMREASVGAELGAIFDKQLNIQKAMAAREEAQGEVEQKERLVQHKLSMDVLSNMDSNIAHQAAFTTQISKEYYRRSLELQFKSYYVQADTLKTMREHYKAFTIQFTNIEKNTGLPDFVKLRNTEKLKDMLREQTIQSVHKQLFSNSKYVEGVKKRMGSFVQDKVSAVTGSIDEATNVLDMLNGAAESGGPSALTTLAGMLASMGGDTFGEKIASKISPAIKEKLKDNKYINSGANHLGSLSASPSSFLENMKRRAAGMAEENEDAGSPGRWMKKVFGSGVNALLEAGTPGAESLEIKQDGYLTHNRPAVFDNNVHRSITEVIPLYLAHILRTTSDLSSMYGAKNALSGGSELQLYDFAQRKLSTSASIAKNIKDTLFKENTTAQRVKGVGSTILSDVSSTVASSDLGKVEKMRLRNQLKGKGMQDAMAKYLEQAGEATGGAMDYDTLFKDHAGNAKLKDIIDSDPQIQQLMKVMEAHQPKGRKHINERLSDAQRIYPIESLKNMLNKLSVLAASPVPHNPTDAVATPLARAFTDYQFKTGKDVTIAEVMNRGAFKYLRKKDADSKELIDTITLLCSDVKKVMQSGDTQDVSGMEMLFALMNNSLREGRDIDPEVFQSMALYYPGLFSKGISGQKNKGGMQLNAQNLREGHLRIGGDDEYIEDSDLISVAPLSGEGLRRTRLDVSTAGLLDAMMKRGKSAYDEVKKIAEDNRGDPSAMADALLGSLKTYKSSVTERLTEQTKKLKESASGFLESNGVSLDSMGDAALDQVLSRYDSLISHLDATVKLKEKDVQEKLIRLAETQEQLEMVSNRQGTQHKGKKLTEAFTKASQRNLQLLRSSLQTLKEQRAAVQALKGTASDSLQTKLGSLKSIMQRGKERLESAIKEYETQGQDAFA